METIEVELTADVEEIVTAIEDVQKAVELFKSSVRHFESYSNGAGGVSGTRAKSAFADVALARELLERSIDRIEKANIHTEVS